VDTGCRTRRDHDDKSRNWTGPLLPSGRGPILASVEAIAKVTEKYPVEFALGGFRFVFVARAEIEDVIQRLDEELARRAA
jgi:hypothetical protein